MRPVETDRTMAFVQPKLTRNERRRRLSDACRRPKLLTKAGGLQRANARSRFAALVLVVM